MTTWFATRTTESGSTSTDGSLPRISWGIAAPAIAEIPGKAYSSHIIKDETSDEVRKVSGSRESQKSQGLKVIGAGFGRTGTLSLKVALEQLGFGPCYHMVEVFGHDEHLPYWEAAANGEVVDWNKIFGAYQAVVDWPACAYYEQLMETYPDAKVLLTVRDPDRWYESAQATIFKRSNPDQGLERLTKQLLVSLASLKMPNLKRRIQMINKTVWQNTFDGRFLDRAYAISVYQRHIEQVSKRVPADKLLVYEVKQGWEGLCAFLNVPVRKDTPFPHLNDRESFGKDVARGRLPQKSESAQQT